MCSHNHHLLQMPHLEVFASMPFAPIILALLVLHPFLLQMYQFHLKLSFKLFMGGEEIQNRSYFCLFVWHPYYMIWESVLQRAADRECSPQNHGVGLPCIQPSPLIILSMLDKGGDGFCPMNQSSPSLWHTPWLQPHNSTGH